MRTPLCLSHLLDWLSECIFLPLSFRANLTSSLWLSEGCLTTFSAALISPESTRGSLHLLVGISAPSQASRRESFKQKILEGDCICSLAVSSYSGFTLGFLSARFRFGKLPPLELLLSLSPSKLQLLEVAHEFKMARSWQAEFCLHLEIAVVEPKDELNITGEEA